jgi:NDP-sugar pyrophosphorylase family protein
MDKERVTITLPPKLLGKIDEMVDGETVRNRSHAVELLVSRSLGREGVDTAFVLAGGEGTRLRPITNDIPKQLVPVNGKPIGEHIVEWLARNGIKRVILGVGYKKDKIRDYFGSGSRWRVSIEYSEEDKPMGTGGCLLLARDRLRSTFVMMNGDILTSFDLREMIEFHRNSNALVTIALKGVEDPARFGVADLHGPRVARFIEKPGKGEAPTNLINAGVYVMEPAVLDYVGQSPCSLERDVFPKIASAGKMFAFPIRGPWFDIGTLESLKDAEKALRKGGQ